MYGLFFDTEKVVLIFETETNFCRLKDVSLCKMASKYLKENATLEGIVL